MKKALTLLGRWACLCITILSCAYLAGRGLQHSGWYKERLYGKLLRGDAEQRLHAATMLTYLRAQEQLLAGLKSDVVNVRELSRRGLEHLWFSAAGEKAYKLAEAAYQSTEKGEYERALEILNRLTAEYPRFAEGFNRRAAVFWNLHEYKKSIADSEKALALNPNHYGAWQGIGLCRLQLGDVSEACRCLRAALKIAPHDEDARRCLGKCEELLHVMPRAIEQEKPSQLL